MKKKKTTTDYGYKHKQEMSSKATLGSRDTEPENGRGTTIPSLQKLRL